MENPLTLSRIHAFNAVMERGSFSAAASTLGISQSAINQQIREIERRFEVKLFDKRGHVMEPTLTAEKFYKYTSTMQAAEDEALSFLHEQKEMKDGFLRIGLGNSMPGLSLVSNFQKAYPGIQIQIEMGNWGTIRKAVLDKVLDIGLLPGTVHDPRLRSQVCFDHRVVAIVHKNHPLAQTEQLTCKELIEMDLIFRTPHSSTQDAVDRAFARANLSPKPHLIVQGRDAVIEAVANRMGVGFIYEFASSRDDCIQRIPFVDITESAPEYLFCRADNQDKLVNLFFQNPPML